MGKQYNKVEKRQRRAAYIKRKKTTKQETSSKNAGKKE
jgi:hypothetical protein